MVKTALSVYLMFMALLVGLYFVAAPIIHGDTDEFPIWMGGHQLLHGHRGCHRTGRQFHAQARHGEQWTRCGRHPVPPHKHRLLQRPLALPLVLLEVVRNPLRWRRLRPLLGLDRPALRYRRRSSRSPHMAEHRGHLAERRSCGQTFCRVGLFG